MNQIYSVCMGGSKCYSNTYLEHYGKMNIWSKMNISSILDIATAQVTAGDQHLRWVAPRNSSIVHLKSNVSGQIKSLDLRDICNIELKYLKAFIYLVNHHCAAAATAAANTADSHWINCRCLLYCS